MAATEAAVFGETFREGPLAQGTNTPCTAKSVLSCVETSPSAPPSNTLTCPSCQIARRPSRNDPGAIESAVVVTAQVAPTVVLEVAVQGTVIEMLLSSVVPVSPGPL